MPIRPELRHFYKTPEWKAARLRTRERALDRCQRCGAKNGSYIVRNTRDSGQYPGLPGFVEVTEKDAAGLRAQGQRVVKIQCGCAHLDNDPSNNAPENLAWLDRGCHLRHDRAHHRASRQTRKDLARPLLAEARV